jgi:hypothetical protein
MAGGQTLMAFWAGKLFEKAFPSCWWSKVYRALIFDEEARPVSQRV